MTTKEKKTSNNQTLKYISDAIESVDASGIIYIPNIGVLTVFRTHPEKLAILDWAMYELEIERITKQSAVNDFVQDKYNSYKPNGQGVPSYVG